MVLISCAYGQMDILFVFNLLYPYSGGVVLEFEWHIGFLAFGSTLSLNQLDLALHGWFFVQDVMDGVLKMEVTLYDTFDPILFGRKLVDFNSTQVNLVLVIDLS